MAKRKSPIQEAPVNIDDCLSAIMADAKQRFGDDRVFTGKESEARLVGIQFPSLCLRYLYQSNILPLGRVFQINGIQESCKSAFLYEHYRWTRCCAGKSFHIENESKDSDTLRLSLMNYDYNAVNLFISESLEEWQQILTYLLGEKTVKASLMGDRDTPGTGKTIPIGFGLDSLTAKSSKEQQTKMEEAGFADRAHPIDALKISSYMKFFPQKLAGWPFWFACTNHLKPSKTATGAIDYHSAGGFAPKFQESFETRMQRIGDIDSGDNGVLIKFVTHKNSLGPGRKTMNAAFRWRFDENGRQVSYWDWNAATIDLIDKQLKAGALRSACLDIVDLRTRSAGGKRVWSKTLGISESDAVTYSEAGAMLEQRPELISALHKVLGVREYTVFKTGVDYSQQLKDAIVAVERAQGYAAEYRDGEEIVDDAADLGIPPEELDE